MQKVIILDHETENIVENPCEPIVSFLLNSELYNKFVKINSLHFSESTKNYYRLYVEHFSILAVRHGFDIR